MKNHRLFLAALLLGASGFVCASVPVIKLADTQDIKEQIAPASTVVDHKVGEGSFAYYAENRSSAASASAIVSNDASIVDPVERSTDSRYAMLVASHPALKRWAVFLLGLGCLMYLGRHGRRRPLPFRAGQST